MALKRKMKSYPILPIMANPISLNGNRSALENLPVRLRQDIGNYRVKKQNGYEIRVHAANSRMRAGCTDRKTG